MARISSGTLTVVIFATLIGLGGAFVVRQQLQQPRVSLLTDPEPAPPTYIVPVAAMDLEQGQTLTINEIALSSMSAERYADSPYAGKAYMRNAEQISGRTLRKPLKKGEIFLPEDFFAGGSGPQIVDRLQPGYRAVTVPIDNVGAVHGFAGPGSVVDVLFRSRAEGDRPEVTLTLVERVEVLALAANVVPGQQVTIESGGAVTLAVTPQQAKVLKVVEGQGELSLTLRSDDDVDVLPFDLRPSDPFLGRLDPRLDSDPVAYTGAVHETRTLGNLVSDSVERVTMDDLLGLPAKQPAKQIEIYLGAEKSVVEFQRPPNDSYQLLQKGGRIRTPIAHDSQSHPSRLGSKQQAQRTVSSPALVSAGR